MTTSPVERRALRGMLAHLVRKGRIRKLPIPERCRGRLQPVLSPA